MLHFMCLFKYRSCKFIITECNLNKILFRLCARFTKFGFDLTWSIKIEGPNSEWTVNRHLQWSLHIFSKKFIVLRRLSYSNVNNGSTPGILSDRTVTLLQVSTNLPEPSKITPSLLLLESYNHVHLLGSRVVTEAVSSEDATPIKIKHKYSILV